MSTCLAWMPASESKVFRVSETSWTMCSLTISKITEKKWTTKKFKSKVKAYLAFVHEQSYGLFSPCTCIIQFQILSRCLFNKIPVVKKYQGSDKTAEMYIQVQLLSITQIAGYI